MSGGPDSPSAYKALHRLRAFDAKPVERESKLAECDGSDGEQKGFPRGVRLGKDVVVVVEGRKLLRKLEACLARWAGSDVAMH